MNFERKKNENRMDPACFKDRVITMKMAITNSVMKQFFSLSSFLTNYEGWLKRCVQNGKSY